MNNISRWMGCVGLSVLLVSGAVSGFMYAQEEQEPEPAELPFVYDDKDKRDPFWPLVGPNGTIVNYGSDFSITDLNLEGVMANPDGTSFAIINGNVVQPNDIIGQFEVITIGADFVVLVKGQEKFELKLTKED